MASATRMAAALVKPSASAASTGQPGETGERHPAGRGRDALHRPAGNVEGELVKAERGRAEGGADDGGVNVRVPSTSRLAPAIGRRTEQLAGPPPIPARQHEERRGDDRAEQGDDVAGRLPQAKLIAPRSAKASPNVAPMVTATPAPSPTIRRPCMNSRLIRLNGTQTNPSMVAQRDSGWIRLVARGSRGRSPPRARQRRAGRSARRWERAAG